MQEIIVKVSWNWPGSNLSPADIKAALDLFAPMYSCQVEEMPLPIIKPPAEGQLLTINEAIDRINTSQQTTTMARNSTLLIDSDTKAPLQVSNYPPVSRRRIKHRKSKVKPLAGPRKDSARLANEPEKSHLNSGQSLTTGQGG